MKRTRRLRPRRAMTLVELLVASTLAVLLMGATLGVTRSLLAQRRAMARSQQSEPWQRRLGEQLRLDLENARKIAVRERELRLVGYGSADFRSGEATGRPAEIVYAIRNEGQRHWLVREEIHLDAATLHNRQSELAAADVAGIAVEDLDKPQMPKDRRSAQAANRPEQPLAYTPLGKNLRVVLHGTEPGVVVLDRRFLLQ